MRKLRLAVVTDIHYGHKAGEKYGHHAPGLIDEFVKAAGKFNADAIIEMGDRISTRDEDTDRRNMIALYNHFNKAAMPVYSVDGNHDTYRLSPQENAQITGNPPHSYSVETDNFHLIFWTPDYEKYATEGLLLKKPDLDWLKADLEQADKPVILVSHVPLDNNPDNRPIKKPGRYGRFHYPNAQAAREIIEGSGKIVLCLAGHRHKNKHRKIGGIDYIALQSLTQAQTGDKFLPDSDKRPPHGAYALLEADHENRKINIDVHGKVPRKYEINF